jgi:Uma2 family endonuclease
MPTAQPISPEPLRRHRLSVEDYYKMGEAGIFKEKDRVELIEGEVIDMVPIGSQHAYTLNKLNRIFSKQTADEILVRIQDPLRLDHYNEPEPDFVLVANNNYSTHHPGPADTLLVIEVADSSLTYDINIKTPLYALHNIPEVWVINLIDKKIHVFENPTNGKYQKIKEVITGKLSPARITGLIIDLENLW